MYIRFSRQEDKDIINELLMTSFGEREDLGALYPLNNRYLLAFEDNQLVALTSLEYSEEYRGYKIGYTCTHPNHRGRGIMHELFRRICSITDEDIYCSCWRIGDNDKINLRSLMCDFGFKEVVPNRVSYRMGFNCKEDFVCVYNSGNKCKCYEDLYLRPARFSELSSEEEPVQVKIKKASDNFFRMFPELKSMYNEKKE